MSNRSYKRWTDLEIGALLNYMIESIQGRGYFGPKSPRYYQKLIQELQLEVTPKMLQNKIQRIKSKYRNFVLWKKTVQIQGEYDIAVASKRKFKWYVESEKIWGKDISIHPPYVSPATTIGLLYKSLA
ncbi:unnamed protein product [Allacma fusca]|uniref:Uncharacterized protein n=1 Tax=Allacma fusca TaxID=39272 RepID=A0A8J2M0Q3_9HEXA|nr:unnamed protein product [Allacma fusca]